MLPSPHVLCVVVTVVVSNRVSRGVCLSVLVSVARLSRLEQSRASGQRAAETSFPRAVFVISCYLCFARFTL